MDRALVDLANERIGVPGIKSTMDGTVEYVVNSDDVYDIHIRSSEDEELYTFKPPFGAAPLVKVGATVRTNQLLWQVFPDVPATQWDNPRRLRASLNNTWADQDHYGPILLEASGFGATLDVADNRTVTLYPCWALNLVAIPAGAVVMVDVRTLAAAQVLHNGAVRGSRGLMSWDLRTTRRVCRWEDLPVAYRKQEITRQVRSPVVSPESSVAHVSGAAKSMTTLDVGVTQLTAEIQVRTDAYVPDTAPTENPTVEQVAPVAVDQDMQMVLDAAESGSPMDFVDAAVSEKGPREVVRIPRNSSNTLIKALKASGRDVEFVD
jgi:hypothetical protein